MFKCVKKKNIFKWIIPLNFNLWDKQKHTEQKEFLELYLAPPLLTLLYIFAGAISLEQFSMRKTLKMNFDNKRTSQSSENEKERAVKIISGLRDDCPLYLENLNMVRRRVTLFLQSAIFKPVSWIFLKIMQFFLQTSIISVT